LVIQIGQYRAREPIRSSSDRRDRDLDLVKVGTGDHRGDVTLADLQVDPGCGAAGLSVSLSECCVLRRVAGWLFPLRRKTFEDDRSQVRACEGAGSR
jgi:hypothetical protein